MSKIENLKVAGENILHPLGQSRYIVTADSEVDAKGNFLSGSIVARMTDIADQPRYAKLLASAPAMYNALQVLVNDPRIQVLLEEHDPQALKQAREALPDLDGPTPERRTFQVRFKAGAVIGPAEGTYWVQTPEQALEMFAVERGYDSFLDFLQDNQMTVEVNETVIYLC